MTNFDSAFAGRLKPRPPVGDVLAFQRYGAAYTALWQLAAGSVSIPDGLDSKGRQLFRLSPRPATATPEQLLWAAGQLSLVDPTAHATLFQDA